jgi:hypothetical protein
VKATCQQSNAAAFILLSLFSDLLNHEVQFGDSAVSMGPLDSRTTGVRTGLAASIGSAQ